MNEQTKELIAIGASVSAHCQPCLTYHVGKAREVGVSEEQIAEAIQMGQMVEKGAERAMSQFADEVIQSSAADSPSPCCPGGRPRAEANAADLMRARLREWNM